MRSRYEDRRYGRPSRPPDDQKSTRQRATDQLHKEVANTSICNIIYGPADEIESHPANKPHPLEEWKYRYIGGLGDNVILTFIDRTGRGDYQLALNKTILRKLLDLPGRPVKKNPASP